MSEPASRYVIVHGELREAIYRRVDDEIERSGAPVGERDQHYMTLLRYYDEHGVIPDFTLEKQAAPEKDGIVDESQTLDYRTEAAETRRALGIDPTPEPADD